MFNYVKRKWLQFRASASELRALNELLMKTGRRVTYDLRHCIDYIGMPIDDRTRGQIVAMFSDRLEDWHAIFNPADIGKDYQSRLGSKIYLLEREIARLETLCREHNIDPTDPDKLPF